MSGFFLILTIDLYIFCLSIYPIFTLPLTPTAIYCNNCGGHTVVDGLISKMDLTAVEYETLSILMAGFTMLQIGKILNANRTTIWRRQNSIRKKYMATLQ